MPQDTWRPAPQVDSAVRDWLKSKGLPVESTRYYAEEEVYAWRHESAGGSPTLWIARPVLEDHSAGELVAALEALGVADRMRATPMARFLVVDEDTAVKVTPWPHRPHRGA